MSSYHQISRAADRLYEECVASGARTQGGWIRDIGKLYFDVLLDLCRVITLQSVGINTRYCICLVLGTDISVHYRDTIDFLTIEVRRTASESGSRSEYLRTIRYLYWPAFHHRRCRALSLTTPAVSDPCQH